MPVTDVREVITDLVAQVTPLDDDEAASQTAILQWIAAGAPLFRTRAPDVPPMHLAVYFALLDEQHRSVLLVDHIKAGCWLLPGGHVDPGEDPRATVLREAREELALDIGFHDRVGVRPFFLSVTATRGPHRHTDVSLWFRVRADDTTVMSPDPGEFRSVRWFDLADTDWTRADVDPHMARFVRKLNATTRV